MNKKILILIYFLLSVLDLSAYELVQSSKNCNERKEEIWRHHLYGKDSDARKILKNCIFSGDVTVDSMNVLKAELYYREKKYQAAIKAVEPSKERIIKFYNLRGLELREGETANDIGYIYYMMLENQGNTYFVLENYKEALKNYNLYIDSAAKLDPNGKPNIYVLHYAAYSYYYLIEYDKALQYSKQLHSIVDNLSKKRMYAYNIAALYAKSGDIKQSQEWLKLPMQFDAELYYEKVQKDSDFRQLLEKKEFNDFLAGFKPITPQLPR